VGAARRRQKERERPGGEEKETAGCRPEPASDTQAVLELQRAAGNAAVTGLLGRGGLGRGRLVSRGPAKAPEAEEKRGGLWESFVGELAGAMSGPPSQADRDSASDAIDELWKAMDTFITAQRRWRSRNLTAYVRDTASNPSLSWDAGMAYAVYSNALANAAAIPVDKWIDKRVESGGDKIWKLPAKAVGFALGVLVESGVGLLLDQIHPDRTFAEAAERVGDMILKQESEADAAEDAKKEEAWAQVKELKGRLKSADSAWDLERLRKEALALKAEIGKPFDKNNMDLHRRLLRDWVREHARAPWQPGRDVDPAQWEEARDDVFLKGGLQVPELFAYQTRGFLSKLGLSTLAINLAIGEIQRASGWDARLKLAWKYHGYTANFLGVKDPAALMRAMADNGIELSSQDARRIRENKIRLKCVLALKGDNHCVVVDRWVVSWTFIEDGREDDFDPYLAAGRRSNRRFVAYP